MSTAMVTTDGENKRTAALLKAVGLDRVPPEQRELAMNIADRYELDLMLKHIVLIDGRPYITRDGLLHIAHRSGQFDGMEVTDPTIVEVGTGKFWTARCSVFRKDMSRPFAYAGRYPTSGGNQKFAPEMATKVAEVMALRRAFDVSAPVMEERWDADHASIMEVTAEAPRTAKEAIAARAASLTTSAPAALPTPNAPVASPEPDRPGDGEDDAVIGDTAVVVDVGRCEAFHADLGRCVRSPGHPEPGKGPLFHHDAEGRTWK